MEYHNPTPVKTPRITAVNMLLNTNFNKYMNPFPRGAILDRIEFLKDKAIIYLQFTDSSAMGSDVMNHSLRKTLEPFGIKGVEIRSIPW